MNVWSCRTATTVCSPLVDPVACTPARFDPADLRWGGGFDGVVFGGNADPLQWLSSRSWLWPLLREAVVQIGASALATYQVPARFLFEVEWFDVDPVPTVRLHITVPRYPYEHPGFFQELVDEGVAFLWGKEGEPPPPHAAALDAIEHPMFDGIEASDSIIVSMELMAPPISAERLQAIGLTTELDADVREALRRDEETLLGNVTGKPK